MDPRERLNDPQTATRAALEGWQAQLWTALPGTINSVNLAEMTVSVQPAIKAVVRLVDGTTKTVALPLLVDCPIIFPSGGGFTLTFPIAPGDECLIIFASRCIDAWWQSSGIQPQAELRMHDLSDGFVIIGPRSRPRVLDDVSVSKTQLRSDDGATFIEIDAAGNINMKANTKVTLTTPELHVTGKITAGGDVTGGTISLEHHKHPGVQTGSGQTGEPV